MSVDYKIELKKLVSALQVEAKSHHKNRDFLQLLPFNPCLLYTSYSYLRFPD